MSIQNNQTHNGYFRRYLSYSIAILLFLGSLAMTGCGSRFSESYYFKSVDIKTGQPVNYYRFQVSGWSWFVNSRYVSGYYDEQALNLFFNEMKIDNENRRIIPKNQQGKEVILSPIDSSQTNGTFVMIMSTDASSIAQTIGAFAESQVTSQAITNLINRDAIKKANKLHANLSNKTRAISALKTQLDDLKKLLPDPEKHDKDELEAVCRQIIRTISRSLKGPDSIETFDEAQGWISTIKN